MKNFLLFCSILLTTTGWAQTPQYFVGSNTGSNSIPFGGGTWANNRSQLLYLPGEFGATVPAGLITTIYFRAAATTTNATYANLQIDMGQSAITTLSTTWETGLSTVLTSPSYVITATTSQWFAIPLATPIAFNPAQSLIVDIRQTATTGTAIPLRNFAPAAPPTNRRTWTGPNPSTSATAGGIDNLVEYDFGFDMLLSCDSVKNFKFNNLTRHSVDISWDPQPGASAYEYVVDQIKADPPSVGYATVNVPALSLNNLPDGTCYYVHIRTNCGPTKMSNWSLDSFCTIADCKTPEVTIDNITGTTAIARWNAVPGVLSYEYAVGTTPDTPTNGNTTTYTSVKLLGLTPNKPLYFYLKAKCSPTPASEWGTTPFHTEAGTAINDVNHPEGNVLEAYPNPVKDVLNLRVNGDKNATITLTDITGKTLRSYNHLSAEMTIDMKELATGVYILKYSSDGMNEVIKVNKK
jgi:hypothetical protein